MNEDKTIKELLNILLNEKIIRCPGCSMLYKIKLDSHKQHPLDLEEQSYCIKCINKANQMTGEGIYRNF